MFGRILQKALIDPIGKALSPSVLELHTAGAFQNDPIKADAADDTKDLLETYTLHPWVYTSIFDIASSASGLPFDLLMEFPDGSQEKVADSPLTDLLERPNPWMTRSDLWEAYFIAMETAGMAFWELRTENGRPVSPFNPPVEIYFLRPDRITISKSRKEYINGYFYEVNGREISFRKDQIIFFRYWNPVDDYNGLSSIKPSKLSITTDLYAMSWNSKFFENGAIPEGMLTTEKDVLLSDLQRDRMKKQLLDAHQGSRNWRKPLVLEGMKWVERQKSQQDMEFTQLREMARDEILATTGESKLYAGLSEQINRATAEVEERLFWQKTMIPKLRKLENALDMHLIPLFGDGQRGKHDLSGIEALQPSVQLWIDTAVKAAGNRQVLTQNEARDMLAGRLNISLPHFEGGDDMYDNLSNVPIGTVREQGKFGDFAIKKNGRRDGKSGQFIGNGFCEESGQENASFLEFYDGILRGRNGKSSIISSGRRSGSPMPSSRKS